jgi:hypothetical protein
MVLVNFFLFPMPKRELVVVTTTTEEFREGGMTPEVYQYTTEKEFVKTFMR